MNGVVQPLSPFELAESHRSAVFLDFENLVLGAGEKSAGHGDPVPVKALEWLCRGFGNASVRRAYADWGNQTFGRFQRTLATSGVDLIQIGRYGSQHKNAADIRMSVDAMEMLIIHPDVGTFILVTGDSDYTPLVSRLREHGKHVVGVGTKAGASSRLVSVCSQYRYWEAVVSDVDPNARRRIATQSDIAEAETLLVRAFDVIASDTPTASAVKLAMHRLDPSFDEANYGCAKFRDLLERLSHRVATVGQSGLDITVRLVEPTSATIPQQ